MYHVWNISTDFQILQTVFSQKTSNQGFSTCHLLPHGFVQLRWKRRGCFQRWTYPVSGGDQTTKQAANVWIMVSLRRFPLIFGALFGLVSYIDPRHKPGKVVVGKNWGFLETKIKEPYLKRFSLLLIIGLIGFQYDAWKVQVASLFPKQGAQHPKGGTIVERIDFHGNGCSNSG